MSLTDRDSSPFAVVGDRLATDLTDVTSDLGALDSTGFWAVVLPFDSAPVLARFAGERRPRTGPDCPRRGGITWDSTPEGEWAETELKAARLLAVASGSLVPVSR
ncbi:MAG TPA: hypothetical protein VID93_09695 [Acidimicrobiales bacterium]